MDRMGTGLAPLGKQPHQAHLVDLDGRGMTGLAQMLVQRGCVVTGSVPAPGPAAERLRRLADQAERLQLAQSTVTELVRRAEEIGLVERERSSVDGRIAHLRLTAEGERRLAETFTSNATERQTLLDAFDSIRGRVTAG